MYIVFYLLKICIFRIVIINHIDAYETVKYKSHIIIPIKKNC